eukprot:CAMPEP_0201547944 /NCGR_PEP_ID=MMETSP0173_2-20130828/4431_1 /ASSEMBLY_ACC=CAM_ASM_000268 /TAXON_ID=218659 /ORGANISM="Vexillifera sp., Strain DIVA3 564/2" /LENGTH=80 /DNA_ID=CAMNT_0047957141 /DNA_START=202 /DNA_END=444 /DNA_ORIENTATION=-
MANASNVHHQVVFVRRRRRRRKGEKKKKKKKKKEYSQYECVGLLDEKKVYQQSTPVKNHIFPLNEEDVLHNQKKIIAFLF